MNRDEFKAKIKETVAQRAVYMCSNPDCRDITIGPHSNPDKSLSDGVAAHICAAAKGGPRYDANQTQLERESISNAIWLCHSCSDIVDKDEIKYPKELLLEWKKRHEDFVLNKGMVASFPDIQLHTQDGFTIPTSALIKVTGEHCKLYREHTLLISNHNDKLLQDLRLRVQFPEAIINYPTIKNPAGVNTICKPLWAEVCAKASGSGSVTVTKIPLACENYLVEVDRLLPKNSIEIRLLSIEKRLPVDEEILKKLDDEMAKIIGDEYLNFYILGSFQYEWRDVYYKREFLVPLRFDRVQRKVSSLVCEDYVEQKICIREVF